MTFTPRKETPRARQRRLQVRDEQRPVRTRLEAAEAKVLGSLDTIANAFIVDIADEKAAQLASIPLPSPHRRAVEQLIVKRSQKLGSTLAQA